MTYLKAIIAFAAALCTALGSAAATGHLGLAAVLTSIGGAAGTSGLVAWATNAPAKTP